MTYKYDFLNRKCCYDIIVNRKAYDINTSNGIKIWIENISQLASR